MVLLVAAKTVGYTNAGTIEFMERSILFLLTKWFCCNKIVIKCGCVHSGLLLSGDNKQLRGKQIGDDHDRKKENNSGGCGEADRYLP